MSCADSRCTVPPGCPWPPGAGGHAALHVDRRSRKLAPGGRRGGEACRGLASGSGGGVGQRPDRRGWAAQPRPLPGSEPGRLSCPPPVEPPLPPLPGGRRSHRRDCRPCPLRPERRRRRRRHRRRSVRCRLRPAGHRPGAGCHRRIPRARSACRPPPAPPRALTSANVIKGPITAPARRRSSSCAVPGRNISCCSAPPPPGGRCKPCAGPGARGGRSAGGSARVRPPSSSPRACP